MDAWNGSEGLNGDESMGGWLSGGISGWIDGGMCGRLDTGLGA